MHTINLYVLAESCPKCKILEDLCAKSKFIQDNDFNVMSINPMDNDDVNRQLLIENGYFSAPVLLVDNTFHDFTTAVNYIREQDSYYN